MGENNGETLYKMQLYGTVNNVDTHRSARKNLMFVCW